VAAACGSGLWQRPAAAACGSSLWQQSVVVVVASCGGSSSHSGRPQPPEPAGGDGSSTHEACA
jgi:hypothetical protein